jgi:hypothetical protein
LQKFGKTKTSYYKLAGKSEEAVTATTT